MSIDQILIIVCVSTISVIFVGIIIAYLVHTLCEYIKRKKK